LKTLNFEVPVSDDDTSQPVVHKCNDTSFPNGRYDHWPSFLKRKVRKLKKPAVGILSGTHIYYFLKWYFFEWKL